MSCKNSTPPRLGNLHAVPPAAATREAWAGWLGARPWDLFVTLTSDHRTHPEALHKRFRWYTNQMTRELYGRSHGGVLSPIEWVNGIERHKSGWPHSHGLLRLPGVDLDDPAQLSLARWQKHMSETGGYCWLSRPRNQGETVSYVTKYVTKDGELTFSPNLSPVVDPKPPLLCTLH